MNSSHLDVNNENHLSCNIVGESTAIIRLKKLIARIAPSSKAVLITGPTGSGKELIAASLHQQSPLKNGPLVSVNCSTLPEALVESLLFGHEKGSFTGADKKTDGYFCQANNGTLFLDELGEMPLLVQAKLLRVLETGRYSRVGGSTEQTFGGRVVAATHVDLQEAIKRREFREDLYFRLNVLMIKIVPLNERRDDIPLLIEYLRCKGENPLPFSPSAIKKMQQMEWKGNVRELKNSIERLCLLSDLDEITPDCIEEILNPDPESTTDVLDQVAKIILNTNVPNKNNAIINALMTRALRETNGNKSKAAALIGVHRKVIERCFFAQKDSINNPEGISDFANEISA